MDKNINRRYIISQNLLRLRFLTSAKTFWFLTWLKFAASHVVLTFPPNLYTQNNVYTSGPCQMPPGIGGRPLPLLGGASYNFTWNSAYPHRGGIRIELLNHKSALIEMLIPSEFEQQTSSSSTTSLDNFLFANVSNPTITQRQVLLPRIICPNCVVRLVREAAEWPTFSTQSTEFLFHSCADVDIEDQISKREMCNNHGTFSHKRLRCVCDDLYTGGSCQHFNECETETDCNFNGQCLVDTDPSDLHQFHQQQCFCMPGFFGIKCEQRSTPVINVTEITNAITAACSTNSTANSTIKFETKNLADGFDVFWRVLLPNETGNGQPQIEIVVQAMTTSWVAIGFRSANATVSCKYFPLIPSAMKTFTQFGEQTTNCNVSANISAVRANLSYTTDMIVFTADNQTLACDPPSAANSTNSTANSTFFDHHLHPMDCNDIVWAAVKQGNLSRIRDMYTRDRSTPQNDEFYGGLQTITAATAFETNNSFTTLIFRRLLSASHPTDAVIDGELHIIFARGQNPTMPVHRPASGLELLSVDSQHDLIFNFYHADELKYHGTDHNQRGATKINFFAKLNKNATESKALAANQSGTTSAAVERAISSARSTAASIARQQLSQQLQPCFGQYKSPAICSPDVKQLSDGVATCHYAAEWYYDDALQNGSLRVSIFSSQPNRWLGIGWSKTGQMTNSNIITAWVGVKNQRPTVTDRFAAGLFMPAKNPTQNVMVLGGRRSGERAMAVEFAKPLRSNATVIGFDIADKGCYYLLFPVDGGEYREDDESISKHTSVPVVSQEKVCFNDCTATKIVSAGNNSSSSPAVITS